MDNKSRIQFEEWKDQQESVMFRRGQNRGSPEKEFLDIVNILETLTNGKTPITLMVVGVASGEEPLSLLTILNSLAQRKGKKLSEIVDLHMVDVRPPLQSSEVEGTMYKWIIKDLLDNNPLILESMEDSSDSMQYQVKPQVKKYLELAVADTSHSSWNTSVQGYLRDSDSQQYDCITYNNVHGHITDSKEKADILPGLVSKLSRGGVLITDGDYRDIVKKHPLYEQLKQTYGLNELYPGIFKRTL
jgi:chemotaxis methyl-accepting protein methylase